MSRNERRLAKKSGSHDSDRAQELFAEALRHHQSGQLAEAAQRYRQILARAPQHADSLHLLGVIAHQHGQQQSAIELIGQAIAVKSDVPFFYNNRGLAFAALGQIDAASADYERALALKPDYVEALSNLGNLRVAQQRLEDAIACFKRALAHNPDYAEAQMNLGNALRQQGKGDEAILRYERAIALRPDYAEALSNLGNALRERGALERAAACFERALALRPDFAEAACNLGNLLQEQDKIEAAAAQFERALAARPDYVDALNGLGLTLDRRGEHERAIGYFERALALAADDPAVHNNLGAALQNRGDYERAIEHYQRALALRPDYAEARKNLGGALHGRAGERSGRLLRERLNENVSGVRGQYESLPFPARDPEGERCVLYLSPADTLAKVNQYCFAGSRDFSKGLRVLVAGCGTGDSVIWLGHQLRDTPSEIVALDLSAASLEIATARAAMRGFANIRFVHASLLDLPQLGLGSFDYVTCLGVLHHLPDPDAGLAALGGVLASDGGMAVMVYGLPGRAHIYAMQDVLRRLTAGIADRARKLAIAREVLAALPPTNTFRQREGWENIQSAYLNDDTNLWDTLLHEQDRAYTASGVRDFIAAAGLHVQAFATYKALPASCALQYDPELYVGDAAERARLAALPQAAREDLAEALDGSLALHTVYATRGTQAMLDPAAPEAILSPMSERGRDALAFVATADSALPIVLRSGKTIGYQPSAVARKFLAAIDGRRSNAAIARVLSADAVPLLREIAADLRVPAALHWFTARTDSGTPWPVLPTEGKFAVPLRHEEPVLLVEPAAQAYRAGQS